MYPLSKGFDSNKGMVAMARFVRSGINPAPTQRVCHCLVGAGFTPARIYNSPRFGITNKIQNTKYETLDLFGPLRIHWNMMC